jgi:hypothetical protein
VLAGFVAVAAEAGRPLRGARVLARARTSWMSREAWLGGAFAALAAADLVAPAPGWRAAAAAAGVALIWAQGSVLRAAYAVPAWAVPVMPVVFLTGGLATGAAALLLVETGRGALSARLLGGTLTLLTVHLVVWWAYLTWSRDPAFVEGVRPLRDGRGALAIVGGGYLAPSLLLSLAVAFPDLAGPLGAGGAALVVASHGHVRAALVRKAGRLRAVTLAHPGIPRRPA